MPPYPEKLMDHVTSPRNGGAMNGPDAVGKSSLGGRAPYATLYLRVRASVVREAMFQTFGCGYTIACCSVLTQLVKGESVGACRALTRASIVAALDGLPEDRMFCADIAIEALKHALQQVPDNT